MDTNILFYRLDLITVWLGSAFAVALIRQPYAMSQHLFTSRVAFIFGLDFVLMTGENHSFSLFQHIPKTFNGVKVRTLRWPIHVWKCLLMLPDTHVSSCSTLSQLEPDGSWHCRPGICPSRQGKKLWDNLVIQYKYMLAKKEKPETNSAAPWTRVAYPRSNKWSHLEKRSQEIHRKFTGNSQEIHRKTGQTGGPVAPWITRLTTDQKIPGLTPGWLGVLLQIICVHSFYRLYVFIAHAFNYCGQKRISSTICSWVNLNMTQFW